MDAKRHVVQFPLTKGYSFPHRVDGIAGGAKVMLRPASEGTGVFPLCWLVSGTLEKRGEGGVHSHAQAARVQVGGSEACLLPHFLFRYIEGGEVSCSGSFFCLACWGLGGGGGVHCLCQPARVLV